MYSFIARLLLVPDWISNTGAQGVQQGGDDPPWDTAGYAIARNLFDRLAGGSVSDLCAELKSNPELWKQANNTVVTGGNYPTPSALNYQRCRPCRHPLPMSVMCNVPGGKLGSQWPSVR